MAAAQRIGSTGLDRLKRERNRLNRLGITWGVQASKRQCLAEDNGRAQPVIWRSTWFYWRQNASGYLQSKRIKTDQCTQLQPTSFKSPCGCTPQAADPDWTDWAEWADQPRSATVDADSMCLWFSQSFADGSRWIRKKTCGKKRPLYGKPRPFVPLWHSERSYHIMLQGCEMHSWVVRSPKIDTLFTIPLSGSNAVRILMRSTRKQQRADNLQI